MLTFKIHDQNIGTYHLVLKNKIDIYFWNSNILGYKALMWGGPEVLPPLFKLNRIKWT